MGRVEQVGAAVVEHGAPTGRGWRNAESKETHGGFGKNGSGDADCGLHDHRLNDVRENVADDDAEVAGSESSRRFDEFAFARGEDLPSNQARVADPSAEGECEDEIEGDGAPEGYKRNREKDSGE